MYLKSVLFVYTKMHYFHLKILLELPRVINDLPWGYLWWVLLVLDSEYILPLGAKYIQE